MPRWVDLYPAWWRARYGEEMEALLEDRKPTIGDRVDLSIGAIKARMGQHPLDGPVVPLRRRIAASLALAGAAVWAEAVILSLTNGGDVGVVYRIAAGFLVLSVLCGARGRYTALLGWSVVAVIALGLAVTIAANAWLLAYASAYVAAVAVAIACLDSAARAAEIHSRMRAALVAWGAVIPVTVTAAEVLLRSTYAFADATWLAASILWISAWVTVGATGLRSSRDAVARSIEGAR